MNESAQAARLRHAQPLTAFNLMQPSQTPLEGHESSPTTGTAFAQVPTLSNSYNFGVQNSLVQDPDMPMLDTGMPPANPQIITPVEEAAPRAPGALCPILLGGNSTVGIYNFPEANYATQHPAVFMANHNTPANTHSTPAGSCMLPPFQYLQMSTFQMPSSDPQVGPSNYQMLPPQIPPPQIPPPQILPPQVPTLNPQIQFSQMPPRPVQFGIGFNSNLNGQIPVPVNAAAPSGYQSPLPIDLIQTHGWVPNGLLRNHFGPRPPMTASTRFGYYSDINEFLRIRDPNWQVQTTHTEDCFKDAYSLLCSFHIAFESNNPNDIWFNSWLELQMKEVADYLRSDMIRQFCCRGHGKLRLKVLARVCPHETNCATYRPGLEGCQWREQWDVDMLIGRHLYRGAQAIENHLKQRVQRFRALKEEDIHARQVQRDISLLGRITSDRPTAHLQHSAYIQRQNQREEEINAQILQAGHQLMMQQATGGLYLPHWPSEGEILRYR